MKNRDGINELMEKLKTKTYQYASENGVQVDARGFVSCLNPEHPDRNPSMHWWDEANAFHCFGCGTTADIFYLAHLFENRPLAGREFIEENIFYLAERYGYEYKHLSREMTPEEIERSQYYRTMQLFSDYVTKHKNIAYLENRNITIETAAKLNIGSVPSINACVDHLTSAGCESEIIKNIGIRSNAVNENKMIIIFKDEHGRPVSFTSREMVQPTGNGGVPKYINGQATPIFHKGRLLYMWSDIKKEYKPFQNLVIAEGYIDAITAYQKGYRNIVALGSASFTDDHIAIIERDKKLTGVSIALDQDSTGRKRMLSLVERLKGMNTSKKYSFAVYKMEGKDLDEILNSSSEKIDLNNIFEFQTMFEYELSNLKNNTESLDENALFETFVGIIAKTERPKEREDQARALSKYLTTYSYATILKDVEYLINGDNQRFKQELDKFMKLASNEVSGNTEAAVEILEGVIEDIKEVKKKYNKKDDNIFAKALSNFSMFEEDKSDASLYEIKFGIPWFDSLELVPGNSVIVAAGANVGKTTIYQMIMKNVILMNDNTTVFYCSTDDSAEMLYANVMASLSDLPRSYCKNPFFHPKYGLNNCDSQIGKQMYDKYLEVREYVQDLIRTKRLVIFDVKDQVDTWRGLEKTVKQIATDPDTENRYRVLIVDSANKVSVDGISNENEVAAFMSANLKKLSERYKMLTFENFEINKAKNNARLSQDKLSGSRRMFYDCNVLGFVYNPSRNLQKYKGTDRETKMTWPLRLANGAVVNEPILVTIMEKTKNGNNEMVGMPYFYKLNTYKNIVTPIDPTTEEHMYYQSIWMYEWQELYENGYQN